MKWDDAAEKILIKMLDQLGFQVTVEKSGNEENFCLNITTEHSKCIIGRNGDRLEDIQYLVNRILQRHYPYAPRIKVDCDSYREEQEARLIEKAKEIASKVNASGKSIRTRPLNAYYRRIVHNALTKEGVATVSPKSTSRYKRIEIKPLTTES